MATIPMAAAGSALILIRFQNETKHPRPGAKTPHAVTVCSPARQADLRGPHHPGHGGEHPVGKFLFPKLLPERLLRVEFGHLGRPAVPAHVLGHDQRLGDVGTRSVQDHDEAVWRVGRTDLRQKASPVFGVHGRANHTICLN